MTSRFVSLARTAQPRVDRDVSHLSTDGTSSSRTQTTVEAHLSAHNSKCRTKMLNRKWSIYAAVRAFAGSSTADRLTLPQLPHRGERGIPYDCRKVVPEETRFLIPGRTIKRICQHLWAQSRDSEETICLCGVWCVVLCSIYSTKSTLLNPSLIIDTFMSKTARLYRDSRTANAATSNLDKLNDDLQDVTRIMTKNMEELLWRGDSLDSTRFLSPPNTSST